MTVLPILQKVFLELIKENDFNSFTWNLDDEFDLIIGYYCVITISCQTNQYKVDIFSVGSGDITASDREKISFYIANTLPSSNYITYSETKDQQSHWVEAKDYWIRIAKCFSLMDTNDYIIHLKEDLDFKLITQSEYDLIILAAQHWNTLWTLLYSRWEIIQNIWDIIFEKNYIHPRELLEDILSENADNNYLICFKEHYQKNVKKIRKLLTLKRKERRGDELTKNEVKSLESLIDEHVLSFPVMEITMVMLDISAKTDVFIQTQLKILQTIEDGIDKIQEIEMCKSTSHTWLQGVVVPGSITIKMLEKELYKS